MMLEMLIITQIIVESLPVSSSSHVRLVEMIMSRFGMFLDNQLVVRSVGHAHLEPWFDHVLHGPTMLVLIIFFRHEWWGVVKLFFTKRGFGVVAKIIGLTFIAALIPVLFLYGFLGPFVQGTAFFESEWTMLGGLLVTMVMLFSLHPSAYHCASRVFAIVFGDGRCIEGFFPLIPSAHFRYLQERKWVYRGIILGCVQAVALLPGISRFASTYVVARWLNISPRRAFHICFMIQFPLIVAAFFINGLPGLIHCVHAQKTGALSPAFLGSSLFSRSMGMSVLVATVIAYGMLWLMWKLSQKKKLWQCGWYMVLPIMTLLLMIFC